MSLLANSSPMLSPARAAMIDKQISKIIFFNLNVDLDD
jgi:hypothetical protein